MVPPPVRTTKETSACAAPEASLDLRSLLSPFYLFLSRAPLLPLALSLECLGEKKPQFYSAWQTPAAQPRGTSASCLRMTSTWLSLHQTGLWLLFGTWKPLSQFTPGTEVLLCHIPYFSEVWVKLGFKLIHVKIAADLKATLTRLGY